MDEPKKIIILRSGALGDCVLSTGPLRLLRRRFPSAEITLFGEPATAPLFEGAPFYDKLVAFTHYERSKVDYYRRLFALRRERFDLLIDFQASGGSRIQSVVIGAKTRIGFQRRSRLSNVAYTDPVPHERSTHKLLQLANLLEPLGIRTTTNELQPELPVTEDHRREAGRLLKEAGVHGQFAIMQVTTRPRPDYRIWPMERFVEVAEELHRLGLQVVVTALSRDAEGARNLASMARSPIVNISGKTPALVLAAIAADASLYVGYNTGPMHVAAAMGTPIVALYDVPSDLVEWRPVSIGPVRIVEAKAVSQSPGWRMDTIEVSEVVKAIRDLRPSTRSVRAAER